MRKNCEAHSSQCSEPKRLEYHCVINPFFNETLEVCAYAQNIVLGKLSTIDLMRFKLTLPRWRSHLKILTYTKEKDGS